MATTSDEAAEALAAYLRASGAALDAVQRTREAWKKHFEGDADAPSRERMAEVSALQEASELALDRARMAAAMVHGDTSAVEPHAAAGRETQARVRRKRRKESPFLRAIGARGQRLLRVIILIGTLAAILVATTAGISLALEFAGLLDLVEDPIRLPVGIQLAVLIAGVVTVFVLRKALKPVEDAIYGSKGIRPKPFYF